MPDQSTQAFAVVINRYYQGCNTADRALMMSTFTSDVVHYFVDHGAVKGASELANYWARVGPKTKAHWTLDHIIAEGAEAVIEWSMSWLPVGSTDSELLRGTEWYRFEGLLIAEIRSYHNNYHLQNRRNRELWDFDYAARGYQMPD